MLFHLDRDLARDAVHILREQLVTNLGASAEGALESAALTRVT